MSQTETQVLIAGGGPVGLVTALELNRQGIKTILVERNLTTTQHPKMDITNGRSAEIFRRLGVLEDARRQAVPEDHPMTVVWCSKASEWELARFTYPSVAEQRNQIRHRNDGSLTVEPNMRISQILIEPILKQALEARCEHVDVRFGWMMDSFEQDDRGVTTLIKNEATGETQRVRSSYLVGCDGAGSRVRRQLDIVLDEISPLRLLRHIGVKTLLRDTAVGLRQGFGPKDGRAYLIHFESEDRDFLERFGTSWHVQDATDGSTLISQNDKDTWTLHFGLRLGEKAEQIEPAKRLREILGKDVKPRILQSNAWKPTLAVAESFGRGRVWLAGDAVRQVIPSGGYGMNTGVVDGMTLACHLAAILQGWGGENLLSAYELERRPIALRNRMASFRHMRLRLQITGLHDATIHDVGELGEKARRKLRDAILKLDNLENHANGIEYGYRYHDSSVICHEAGEAPEYGWEHYVPTTWPGSRIPSYFLQDGRNIHDLLGKGFTLLRFKDVDCSGLERAAEKVGMPLEIVDIRDDRAARIYEKVLVLVRSDSHVAWRGDSAPADGQSVVDTVRGAITAPTL